ncbi:MAG: hypothetical protein WCW01_00900 [Gammaproteobacteria bacterium]
MFDPAVVSGPRHLSVPQDVMVSSQHKPKPKPEPRYVLFTQVYADGSDPSSSQAQDQQPVLKNGDPIQDDESSDSKDEAVLPAPVSTEMPAPQLPRPPEWAFAGTPVEQPGLSHELVHHEQSPFHQSSSTRVAKITPQECPAAPKITPKKIPPEVTFIPVVPARVGGVLPIPEHPATSTSSLFDPSAIEPRKTRRVEGQSVALLCDLAEEGEEQAEKPAEEADASEEGVIMLAAPPSIKCVIEIDKDEDSDSSKGSRSSSSASFRSTASSSLASLFDPKIEDSTRPVSSTTTSSAGALRSESVSAIPTTLVPPETSAVARAQSASAFLSPGSRKRHLEKFNEELVKTTEEKTEQRKQSLAKAPAPGYVRDFWLRTWETQQIEKNEKELKIIESNHILKTKVLTEEDRKKMALEFNQRTEAEIERRKQLAEKKLTSSLSGRKHKKGDNKLPTGQQTLYAFFHSSSSAAASSLGSFSSSSSFRSRSFPAASPSSSSTSSSSPTPRPPSVVLHK